MDFYYALGTWLWPVFLHRHEGRQFRVGPAGLVLGFVCVPCGGEPPTQKGLDAGLGPSLGMGRCRSLSRGWQWDTRLTSGLVPLFLAAKGGVFVACGSVAPSPCSLRGMFGGGMSGTTKKWARQDWDVRGVRRRGFVSVAGPPNGVTGRSLVWNRTLRLQFFGVFMYGG